MRVNSIRGIKPGNKLYKKVLAVGISIMVVMASFIFLNDVNREAKNTVDIIRVKAPDGIPAGSLISGKDIESYSIIQREFTSDMIRYSEDNIREVVDKYSLYTLRKKSILYMDQLTSDKPLKNAWIYSFSDPQNEILTLPYNYMECGGDILMPGDRVRVRVLEEKEVPQGDGISGSVPNYGGFQSSARKEVEAQVLFESIIIKDLLNSRGHSIYEVYKEALKLTADKREAVMQSDQFLNNIQPKSLVLEATSRQAEEYAKFKEGGIQSFTFTILQRDKDVNILDQLSTIEKEVQSWAGKGAN